MKIKNLLILPSALALLGLAPLIHAQSSTISERYTVSELQSAGEIFIELVRGAKLTPSKAFAGGEAAGYVAGVFDTMKRSDAKLLACSHLNSQEKIIIRALKMLNSAPPDDRLSAHVGVRTALMYACDEKNWIKK